MPERFVDSAVLAIRQAGIGEPELLSERSSDSFGDAQVVFRLGVLLLRLTSDRGQRFLDIGSTAAPDTFHEFLDLDVAMGWRPSAEIAAMREPEPIAAILNSVARHLDELRTAFAPENEPQTRALIEDTARGRANAFRARLRGNE